MAHTVSHGINEEIIKQTHTCISATQSIKTLAPSLAHDMTDISV